MHPIAAAPETDSPIQDYLNRLHERYAGLDGGLVATYIPELAKALPGDFGIAIATVDGQVYEAGVTRHRFTIQSISKPLVYGVALEDRGFDRVQQAIGLEPTGDAFNSISLEPGTGRPLNPMINAGAIATSSLVAGDTREARLSRVVDALSAYAGRPLGIDEAVFESERSTGHRNRAIGHMLRNYGIVAEDPEPALELYFKQCSVLVDCHDLALVAATLANGGVNPVTGARAVAAAHIGTILSVMTTCGMYDFAGQWVHRVGMPAKSGVGGGIIAVLPGQLGIAVYSPPLDRQGNSVRGVKVCEAISQELSLHFLQPPRPAQSTLRAHYDLSRVRSKRRRLPAERAQLDAIGAGASIYELQGDLCFATIEEVVREIVTAGSGLRVALLDFKRVTSVDEAATRMLAGLVASCARRGQQVVMTRVRRGELFAGFGDALDPRCARAVSFQPQLDLGLEWCERLLLEASGTVHAPATVAALADHQLCEGATAEELAVLAGCVERCEFESGATVIARGDAADGLYFLMQGEVSVVVPLPPGGVKRLATLSAGMGFGEAALILGGARSATVRADTAVACYRLTAAQFARLERDSPGLKITLLHNLLRGASETVRRLTAEVTALEG